MYGKVGTCSVRRRVVPVQTHDIMKTHRVVYCISCGIHVFADACSAARWDRYS
jgi:hypothetical protein